MATTARTPPLLPPSVISASGEGCAQLGFWGLGAQAPRRRRSPPTRAGRLRQRLRHRRRPRVRVRCAPRSGPHAAFRLAKQIHFKNEMKAQILFPNISPPLGWGRGQSAPPRSGAGRRVRGKQPRAGAAAGLPAPRGSRRAGERRGALPQSRRARGEAKAAGRRSAPALRRAGGAGGRTGVRACACVGVRACVCTRAARPPRPSLLGAAVLRPLPFAPPLLPLAAAARASPPPSSSRGESAR